MELTVIATSELPLLQATCKAATNNHNQSMEVKEKKGRVDERDGFTREKEEEVMT